MDKLLGLARSLRKIFPPDFSPTFDIILENPWENPDDELCTLRGVLDLPEPFVLQLYTLTFYPGTVLFDKAIADGIIEDTDVSYLKENHDRGLSYINFLFMLVNKRVPNCIIRLISWKPVTMFMTTTPVRWFLSLFNPMYRALKKRSVCRAQKKLWGWFISEYSGR